MIRFWETASLNILNALLLEGHEGSVLSLAVNAKDGQLASAGADSTVRLWDKLAGADGTAPASYHCTVVLKGHAKPVTCVAYSPNGTQLASGSDDNTVRLWNVAAALGGATCEQCLQGHTVAPGSGASAVPGLCAVLYSPDGLRLYSAGRDWRILVWRLALGGTQQASKGGEWACAGVVG